MRNLQERRSMMLGVNEFELASTAQSILVNEVNSSPDKPLQNLPKTKQDVPSQITTEMKESEIAEEKSIPLPLVTQIENQCSPEPNTTLHKESPGTAMSQNDQHTGPITSQRQNALTKKAPKPSLSDSSFTGFDPKRQKSTSSSKTSLSSSGPSTSSLCHLTELSQPKPEVLQTTLKSLHYLNPSDAKVKHVSEHLKDLRNRPKLPSCRKPPAQCPFQRKRTTLAVAPAPKASANRTMYDRMASKFYEYLELRWETFDNFESAMPVQHVYYQAAYDALTRAFGKPYTKASLELYQLLAADLGREAEMFVVDKTPKTPHIDEHVENIAFSIPGGN
ncbi:hypothetical protein ZHAS_00006900 [Anopheles sinensis]|uniref:Uncharacterized protein n=1 Tax=Anopheles sinensis TaxID=74873 RepID=A0A084VNL1_ANOSI|nr:hypothetical protein ZHAS_00006900 [Anopheles sinensis]